MVDTVLTHDEEAGSLVLFAVNRSQSESVAPTGDMAAFGALQVGMRW